MFSTRLLKKLLSVIFACILLTFAIYPFLVKEEYRDCEFQSFNCEKGYSFLKGFKTNHCINSSHIFFVETSHSSTLNARQACAVESSARHNPSFQVTVLMTPETPIDFGNSLMANLEKLSNVEIIRVDLESFLCRTPIWYWYISGKWKKSVWKASHLSDALRYFLIWNYGGIYLDMDIVMLRSMEKLRNTAITENWDRVASGILVFDKGHKLMRKCMLDFAQNYDPFNFVANGPGVISRNIRKFCDTDDISKVSGAGCGIDILPPVAAFPIPYDKFKDYFVRSSKRNSELFNESYLLHVWNKYSKESKLVIGQNSPYELAMKEHCPIAYEYAFQMGYA
ncbi:hypothetical protein JTE90_001735 [Oedothorax gibbosus]|uniref:Alpha 1,4-glycosyltransferase domain-containing protein n=1 Tax=Oedothorax gibbosus TaxID=931172 RepID=A0AAV6V5N5_9ARAC|nr:hypothetical protein JTE90_001735 [Oedothorax gibbosus]